MSDNWYDSEYAGDDVSGNPFARFTSIPAPGLKAHIAAGGSPLTFRRPEPLPSFDAVVAALGIPGALK